MTDAKTPVLFVELDEAPEDPLTTALAKAGEALDAIRRMCRPEQAGGNAAYVRLADDEPVNDDGQHALPPVLAVPAAEVLRLVDKVAERLDAARTVPLGNGKSASVKLLLNNIIRAGRKSDVNIQPEWPLQQYASVEDLDAALRTGTVRTGTPSLRPATRPARPMLDAGRDGPVEAMLWTQLSKTGTFPGGQLPCQLRAAINTGPAFRFGAIPPISRNEVCAALGVLTAHGRCEIVAEPGRMFRFRATVRPAYAAGTQGHVALAVVVLGLLDTRADGLVMTEIVNLVRSRYQMRPGVEVSRDDVGAAMAYLAGRGFAAVRLGRYRSTSQPASQPASQRVTGGAR